MNQLKITDDLVLKTPLILAPMSGVTDAAFRSLIFKENALAVETQDFASLRGEGAIANAVGMMVTEFVSVEALTRKGGSFTRCGQMMKFQPHERPISIQIFGHDVDRMVQAAEMAEAAGADMLDINCGCPVPKVVRRGGGAELMRRPEQLQKIVSAIKKAIKIPVGVKIRAGWDETHKNAVEIAKLVEGEGASLLTIHARTKAQGYSGKVDYAVVEQVCREISIPVVGSGDIYDIEGAKFYFNLGTKGAMIGRAALKNPWIFRDIYYSGGNGEVAVCFASVPANMRLGHVCDTGAPQTATSPLPPRVSSGFHVPAEKIISPRQSGLTGQSVVLRGEGCSDGAETRYAEIVRVLRDYNLLLRDNGVPENAVLGRLKQLVAQVTKGFVGGTKLRAALCKAKTVEQFFEQLEN